VKSALIFLPVLAQILLTLLVLLASTIAKGVAMKRGEVDHSRRALHRDAWPDYVLKLTNNFANQFETPVLFYVLALIIWSLNAVDALSLTGAWGYFACRVVHVYVHTTSNYVPVRKWVFIAGTGFLLVLVAGAVLAVVQAVV